MYNRPLLAAAAALCLGLSTLVQSRLVVYGPPDLKDKFEYTGKSLTISLIMVL